MKMKKVKDTVASHIAYFKLAEFSKIKPYFFGGFNQTYVFTIMADIIDYLIDAEDETVEDPEPEDDNFEHTDADLEPVLQMKTPESTLPEQSSSSSPTRLQVAIEEVEEDAADIQAIKEEVSQLPDLDVDLKSEADEEQEEQEIDEATAGEVDEVEVPESPIVPTRGRGGGRGRSSGRARRSRGRRP